MLKTIVNMLAGALIVSAVTAAYALGTAPLSNGDQALIDQKWLYGLSGGVNFQYQNSIKAAGTTQGTATALPNNTFLIEVDTVGASSGVNLPQCVQGIALSVYNATATSLTIYPAVTNNPTTAAQDTINNSSSLSLSGHTPEIFMCAKSGTWSAK